MTKEELKEYMVNWRKENPDKLASYKEKHREASKKRVRNWSSSPKGVAYRKKAYKTKSYKEKQSARREVHKALLSGNLIKMPCEVCGELKSQGHHEDYGRPLEVNWLCQKHHSAIHFKTI